MCLQLVLLPRSGKNINKNNVSFSVREILHAAYTVLYMNIHLIMYIHSVFMYLHYRTLHLYIEIVCCWSLQLFLFYIYFFFPT